MPKLQTKDGQTRFVAFLRGVNVGGRVIKNTDLEACFKKMGFRDLKLVLQSGNVIFSAPKTPAAKLVPTIEAGLQKRFDYPAKVMVVSAEELQQIVDAYPFDSGIQVDQHYVLFLAKDVAKAMIAAAPVDAQIERLAPGRSVVYWTVPKGSTLLSPFGKFLGKAPYRDLHTNRNLNTLRKVLAFTNR